MTNTIRNDKTKIEDIRGIHARIIVLDDVESFVKKQTLKKFMKLAELITSYHKNPIMISLFSKKGDELWRLLIE